MTNFEKYENEVLRILEVGECEVPGVRNGIPVICDNIECSDCDLHGYEFGCVHKFINWLYEDDGTGCLPDTSKPKTEEHDGCDGCKYEYKREDESPCTECSMNYMSKFERRPKKTRQDEFLERYPHARTCDGVVEVCPKSLDIFLDCKLQGFSGKSCTSCCKDYWLQEVEE